MKNDALLSTCGSYRYWLTRSTATMDCFDSVAIFVMLNPSTADASLNDPTIRRCIGYAKAWECRGLVVANLYALRATDPKELLAHDDPVGPGNDQHLAGLAEQYAQDRIICAWGANARPNRVARFQELMQSRGAADRLYCLGTTIAGAPRHPLYLRKDAVPVRWPAPSKASDA